MTYRRNGRRGRFTIHFFGTVERDLFMSHGRWRRAFARLSRLVSASPKDWWASDSYLAAFAVASGARLVTFDGVLAGRVKGAVLL